MEASAVEKKIITDGKPRYTYADYEKLPEGSQYQLIGGDLVTNPSPSPKHQMTSRKIEFELVKFVEERNLGEVLDAPMDVFLSETEVFQPDIIFIAGDRRAIIGG
jgi:Uma2 family endonuclease